MKINYEVYILSKADMLSILFGSMAATGDVSFVSEIDRWDWEIENTIEGFAQLSEGIILVKDAKRRVSVCMANSPLSSSLKLLIDKWNDLIELISVVYSELSEKAKRDISLVDIDFDLYIKKVV